MSEESQLTMDMEISLKEDKDGELKARLHSDFSAQIADIDRKLKAGLPPDEYRDLTTIKEGLQSAQVVLERVWLHHHPSS